jgi:hypothetical protein
MTTTPETAQVFHLAGHRLPSAALPGRGRHRQQLLGKLATRMPEESPRWLSEERRGASGRLRAGQAELREAGIALSFRGVAP